MQVGDVGTSINLTVHDQDGTIVNISSSSLTVISFRKPNGATTSRVASFTTNGSDGQMRYITVNGDLDQEGLWEIQAVITMPTGKWYSEVKKVVIGPQIPGA